MASRAAARRVDGGSLDLDVEAGMSAEELGRLTAAIARSDEQIQRGDTYPAEVLLDDLDRIAAGG